MTTLETSAPPGYTSHPQDVELAHLDHSSSRSHSPSLLSAPPPYPAGSNTSNTSLSTSPPTSGGPFHPTLHFQIQTSGKPWLSPPLPSRPDPIPVFSLHPDDSSLSASAHSSSPYYTCLRPERGSGSCYLTTGSQPGHTTSTGTIPVASSTTYRFGPNRPPVVRLFAPHTPPLSPETLNQLLYSKNQDVDVDGAGTSASGAWDTFTINSLGLLTRSIGFRSRLGSFEWRYAGRKERHAAEASGIRGAEDLNNVLVLERVVRVAQAQNGAAGSSSSSKKGKDEEVRTVVAQFLRGEGCRTPGSGSSTAGNGGRLVMDLEGLVRPTGAGADDGTGVVEEKGEREMAVALVVTTCLVMMKREVDRRRAQQIAIMAGAAGN